MKLHYGFLLMALFLVLIVWPGTVATAQDTLTVNWALPDNVTPKVNALLDAIKGDTTALGARVTMNRVYKLMKGGFYWNTERIVNTGFPLRLVGENPDPSTALGNPAVIQMYPRADASVDGRIITGADDVTLKNIWLTGRDYNGVQTYYQPIQMDASGKTFIIDRCVLEHTNFALIAFTGSGNKIIYTNNKFRNLIGQPSTQQWEGRGLSIWADQDTVLVENNTFFNIGFTAFQLEGGASKYVRFNHNTLVNVGRNINAGNWWREAYFVNNLLINVWWHGEGTSDYTASGRDPRALTSGYFGVGALPSKYGPEAGRRVVFAKNAAWTDPAFSTAYGATVRMQYFINPVTKLDYIDPYEQMVVSDTTWLAANPLTGIYDAAYPQRDSMIANITNLRDGITPAKPYWYKLTQFPTDVAWPLQENFSYTNATLLTAGTSGYPLGDLNWFPTQKAAWEAAKAADIGAIEAIAGNKVRYDPVATVQAETGTKGNGAAEEQFSGFSFFVMTSGGSFEWDFTMAAAATVDLKIYTHMKNNNIRGQRVIINGTSIHDSSYGYGELIFAQERGPFVGKPINAWTDVLYIKDSLKMADRAALDLPAGANKLRVEASWGYQDFHGFDLLTAGTATVLKSLRVNNATAFTNVGLGGLNAPFVPQGLKSVKMGTNGTIAWTMDAVTAGNYALAVYYQNPVGTPSGTVAVTGGSTVPISFTNDPDSVEVGSLSSVFALPAGAPILTLTASTVNVDYVILTKQTIITGVDDENGVPVTYALEQNFPNPFNPSTIIRYSIPKASSVELKVYDLLGRSVGSLVNEFKNAGTYDVTFDASRLATGIYFYQIKAGDFRSLKKMVLIK